MTSLLVYKAGTPLPLITLRNSQYKTLPTCLYYHHENQQIEVCVTAAVLYLPGKLLLEGVSGDLQLERETESERSVLIEKGFNRF